MTQSDSQTPWTDEQWARVNQVVQEEASHARVAATFLPLYGPLPADTDFVRSGLITYPKQGSDQRIAIADTDTIKLPTLQVKVFVRGAQMSDPDLTSVLALFRRASNVLARLEDALVFNGQLGADEGPAHGVKGLPDVWKVLGGGQSRGLLSLDKGPRVDVSPDSTSLVAGVSKAIGELEGSGQFGPFALVLGQNLFVAAQTPDASSLVLPQDRIIPFLGGGPLLRSSTLPPDSGVLVALGGAPVELVVATDVSLTFLQLTTDPLYVFRVYEKLALRIKEPDAIVALGPKIIAKEQNKATR
jgi:uncharacterized linocin/CFP29 family protein